MISDGHFWAPRILVRAQALKNHRAVGTWCVRNTWCLALRPCTKLRTCTHANFITLCDMWPLNLGKMCGCKPNAIWSSLKTMTSSVVFGVLMFGFSFSLPGSIEAFTFHPYGFAVSPKNRTRTKKQIMLHHHFHYADGWQNNTYINITVLIIINWFIFGETFFDLSKQPSHSLLRKQDSGIDIAPEAPRILRSRCMENLHVEVKGRCPKKKSWGYPELSPIDG